MYVGFWIRVSVRFECQGLELGLRVRQKLIASLIFYTEKQLTQNNWSDILQRSAFPLDTVFLVLPKRKLDMVIQTLSEKSAGAISMYCKKEIKGKEKPLQKFLAVKAFLIIFYFLLYHICLSPLLSFSPFITSFQDNCALVLFMLSAHPIQNHVLRKMIVQIKTLPGVLFLVPSVHSENQCCCILDVIEFKTFELLKLPQQIVKICFLCLSRYFLVL